MANTNVGPNQNPILYARSSSSGSATYVTATNNKLDVNATLVVESIEIGKVDQGAAGVAAWLVTGTQTNNTALTTTNLGVLPAIANAAAPTWGEGNQVGLSTDLAGNLRVTGSISVGGTTDNSAFTAGSSTGTPAMGFYHSTIDTVTDGRAAAIALDSKRSQFMVIRDAALNARGVNVTAANELLVSVNNASLAVTQSGSWNIGTVTSITNTVTVAGNKTNNNAAPGATNLGVLPALANAAAPSYTEGDQVLLSTDLAGNVRVTGGNFGSAFPSFGHAMGMKAFGTLMQAPQSSGLMGPTGADPDTALGVVPHVSNSSTVDRIIDANTGNATTGTGLLGTGVLGFDGTNYRRLSTDTGGKLNINAPTGTTASNITQFGSTNISTGTGLSGAGIPRVTVSSDSVVGLGSVPQLINNASINGNDIATTAPGTQLVSLAGPTGDPLDSTGNALNVAVPKGTALAVANSPDFGVQIAAFNNTFLTNSLQVVKATAGLLYGWHLYNSASAVQYVQIYDNAINGVIYGTSAPTMTIVVPANGWVDDPIMPVGISFRKGILVAASGGVISSSLVGAGILGEFFFA